MAGRERRAQTLDAVLQWGSQQGNRVELPLMVGPAPAGAPVPAGTPGPPAKGPGACAPRQVQPRRGYLPRPAPFKMAAQLGPTIGTHVGPGVVGVVFVAKE